MSEPFLAEIKIVGFNFAPRGWSFCDGQLLPINQNQSLYSLLGTTYGGDGRTTFGLPDLRGRAPLSPGSNSQGQKSGSETNTLAVTEMPSHTHAVMASSTTQNAATPATNLLATTGGGRRPIVPYGDGSSNITAMTATENTGGQPVNNMQPFLTLNFCIALQGLFPSRN
jgi:microcystin-dependent protein